MALEPLVDQGLLIFETCLSHSDTPQSVGLLWKNDRPDAETPTWKHNIQKRRTSIRPVGFELKSP